MWFKERSQELEWIDQVSESSIANQEYDDCLKQLGNVGSWLLGDRASLKCLKSLKQTPKSFLEVGCGGGYFSKKVARCYPYASVLGLDINSHAIQHCHQYQQLPNLTFELTDKSTPLKNSDLILATLVCHHLTDSELIDLLKKMYKASNQAIVINDLHRHVIAYLCFACIAPWLFRHRWITHDGLISIKRGFKLADWKNYLHAAGITNYKIRWHFPFRWTVTIAKDEQ